METEENKTLSDLGARKRNHKIYITDEAISIHNLERNLKNAQKAANHFLNECFRANIVYEDR